MPDSGENMKMQSITVGVILFAVFFLSTAGAAQESNTTEELVDDIGEYEGSVGPGSIFYRLKLSVEKLDIAITFNESEKLGKQVSYTRLRIAEAKAELKRKNNATANRALAKYREDSEEIANAVAKLTDKEKGLLNAQKMIAKHQLVLRNLLNETPDNIGLQRAYDNSIELEKRFEEKTRIKLERRLTKQGRKVLEEVEIEEEREKIEVKAKILENATRVEVEIKFVTNKTENFTIADEILNRIEFINENINSLIKIEEEEEEEKEKLREELEAEAEVRENISRVKFEYRFFLDATNQSEIISGIQQRLSALEQNSILAVLEMEVKELEMEEKAEKKLEKREERNKSKDEGEERESEED